MKSIHAMVIVATISLSACSTGEAVQTVDWYKAHAPDRKAMLDRCHASPGELALTPNCINASKANNTLAAQRRGYVQPAPIHAKIGG